MENCERIDWKEISDRGLLVRINREIMHPLGLAVYRDVEKGVSPGALISPDGKWEYGDDEKAKFVIEDSPEVKKIRGGPAWVEIVVGAYGLVAVTKACPNVQHQFKYDVINVLELVKEIRTRFFSDRKGNPMSPRQTKFIVGLVNGAAGYKPDVIWDLP